MNKEQSDELVRVLGVAIDELNYALAADDEQNRILYIKNSQRFISESICNIQNPWKQKEETNE